MEPFPLLIILASTIRSIRRLASGSSSVLTAEFFAVPHRKARADRRFFLRGQLQTQLEGGEVGERGLPGAEGDERGKLYQLPPIHTEESCNGQMTDFFREMMDRWIQ